MRHQVAASSIMLFLVSCDVQSIAHKTRSQLSLTAKLKSSSPYIAKPGETVEVVGRFTDSHAGYRVVFTLEDGSTKEVPLTIERKDLGSFVMPTGLGLGERKFVIVSDTTEIGSLAMIAADSEFEYYSGDASRICSTETFFNKSGKKIQGTKDCAQGSAPNCTADGVIGCVTTSSFISANASTATPANIKSGVTIAGQVGDYPSATYPLAGADGTADLSDNQATREGQLRSATNFEFFKSDGSRVVASGDADIVASNIKDTVGVFGLTGNYQGEPPNAWDVRAGVSVGSVTGLLKVNCRNGADLGVIDRGSPPKEATVNHTTNTFTITSHGWSDNQEVQISKSTSSAPNPLWSGTNYFVRNATANTFQLAATSGGAALDLTTAGTDVYVEIAEDGIAQDWDTFDDFYGPTPNFPSSWNTSLHQCGGIETVANDGKVWKDVTTTGDGVTASNCATTAAHCSLKDQISGLEWHKPDATDRNWIQAYQFCSDLSYNGKTDWRLPTEKELFAAYANGIVTTANATNWIALADLQFTTFWSSSSSEFSGSPSLMATGFGYTKTDRSSIGGSFKVICVRP